MEQTKQTESFWSAVARISAQSGRSTLSLLAEIARLRLGKGRLSFQDYLAMRLFDQDWFANCDKTNFVGFRQSQRIWRQANYRVDLYGLVDHKLACDIIFAAHGFPVLQTVAFFRERVGLDNAFLLKSESELKAFLRESKDYPLFGKPIDGHQSLGSASLERYEPEQDCLIDTMGHRLSLEHFIAYVRPFSGHGYLFQRRQSPHASLQPLCGNRLATVRLLTIQTKGQSQLLRACWKIPTALNVADNFWRDGNLLAQLDLETGQVLRVLCRIDQDYEEITHHPLHGTPLIGMVVPNWDKVVQLALDAAKVIDHLPLVGWDVAPTNEGAVLVELNETPDFRLHQIADRQGILDRDLRNFLELRQQDFNQTFHLAKLHNRGQ